MAKYLEFKDNFEKVKLKYSLAAIKDRKKMGITSVDEHKQVLNREMEIVSGKSMKELLSGSVEEYNKTLKEVERQSYKLDLMKAGVNYKIYENQHLKPYLNLDGSINESEIKKKIEDNKVQVELFNIKNNLKLNSINKVYNKNLKNIKIESEERTDLKMYFPHFDIIEQSTESNIVFMEYDYIEVDSLAADLTSTFNYNFPYFKKEYCAKSDKALRIIEQAEAYRKMCNQELLDKVTFVDWGMTNVKQFRNYTFAYNMVSLGSQEYIDYVLSTISDSNIKEELERKIFTSIFTSVNPIGPNVVATKLYSNEVVPTNPYSKKYTFPLRYDDEPIARKMIEEGIPIDVYDIRDGKILLIKKYNQD